MQQVGYAYSLSNKYTANKPIRKIINADNTICIMLFVTDCLDNGLRPIEITELRMPEYIRLPANIDVRIKITIPTYTRTGLTCLPAIASVAFSRNSGKLDSVG